MTPTRSQAMLVILSMQASSVASFVPLPVHRNIERTIFTMSKDSDRARAEKNFDDMMDNDWRQFRARLVAQEKIEEKSSSSQNQKKSSTENCDEGIERQERLGNLFADTFSNIFNNSKENKNTDPGRSSRHSIFDGDFIGGQGSVLPDSCEDPFVSIDEIPVLMEPKVKLDKHRWAFSLPNVEPGCVLIANEKLGGVFHQTVVLIIDHAEDTGSTGIIINRPLEGDLKKIASETTSNVDLSLKLAFHSSSVGFGGPVMPEEYSIVHGYGEVEGSKKVSHGVYVGGSEELLNERRKNKLQPSDALFVKGHAAWVPQQLEREISKGVWYVASASSDFVLKHGSSPSELENEESLWSQILTCMGDEYSEIAKTDTVRSDKRMKP